MSGPASIVPATSPPLGTPAQAALPIGETRVPAAVREGSSAAKQAYATAQGFEEMLLQQLSETLAQSDGLGGEGAGGSGEEEAAEGASPAAGGGELQTLMPQALTEGIMRDGGIGLAAQLLNTLDPAAAKPQPGAALTGAAAPVAGTQGAITAPTTTGNSGTVTPSSGGGTGGISA